MIIRLEYSPFLVKHNAPQAAPSPIKRNKRNHPMNGKTFLSQEWQTLQNNHEQHERNALFIKLSSLALGMAGLAAGVALGWIALVVLLLWVLEGIFKTYQARLAERLLQVEALLAQEAPVQPPMQLNTEWMAQRPGGAGLIVEYALSACRPTVAFPYLPLLLFGGLARMLGWV